MVLTVVAESSMENQNVSVFLTMKAIHHVNLADRQLTLAIPHHADLIHNVPSSMELLNVLVSVVSLKVLILSEGVLSR